MSSTPLDPCGSQLVQVLPRRRWGFPRSLRARLTAWNTFTILLLAIALLYGLREGLFYMLLQEEDRLLQEDAMEVSLLLERYQQRPNSLQEALDRKAESHAPRKWFARIMDGEGNLVHATHRVPNIAFPEAKTASAETVESFRTVQRRHTSQTGRRFIIRVGATTDDIHEDVNRLTQLLVFAGITLLIVAPLGGYWLAGRAIRPLARIIQTTAELRPRQLEERLPIRNTGDELDQLSATINGFLNRIADYLGHHHELLANVAHELRSPLAAIRSSTEVALNQDRTPEEYRELLASIVGECSRLGNLVQRLLLLAESDAGRLERADDPVRFDQLVHKAIDMFQGVAESRGVDLEATQLDEVWVSGDAGQLRQVVLNLIDNAVKFTPGGSVKVVVANQETTQQALLTVDDSGCGIAPEHLQHIFERFYRAEKSRSRTEHSGSGLGLSICQALVTVHGGTIRVESKLGGGTHVEVALPLGRLRRNLTEL